MDNRPTDQGINNESLIKFLNIGGEMAKIYRTDKVREILEFISVRTLCVADREKVLKRLVRIIPIDPDIKSFCECLNILIATNFKSDIKSNYSYLSGHLTDLILNIGKGNISTLVYILSLPESHVLFQLIEKRILVRAINDNITLLISSINHLDELAGLCNNSAVNEFLSSNFAHRQVCENKWMELLKNVDDLDYLRKLYSGLNCAPEFKRIVDRHIAQCIIRQYDNSHSTIVLFHGCAELQNDQSKNNLMRLLLEPENQGKGLNDICEYIEKRKEIFVQNGPITEVVTKYIDSLGDIAVMAIYFIRVFKIEPKDSRLLDIIRQRCQGIIGNIPINNPPKWFTDYIDHPDTIPYFLKPDFVQKAKEIIGA